MEKKHYQIKGKSRREKRIKIKKGMPKNKSFRRIHNRTMKGGSSLRFAELPIKYYYPLNSYINDPIYLAESARNLPPIVGGKKNKTQRRKLMVVKRGSFGNRNAKLHKKKYSFKKHLDKMPMKMGGSVYSLPTPLNLNDTPIIPTNDNIVSSFGNYSMANFAMPVLAGVPSSGDQIPYLSFSSSK